MTYSTDLKKSKWQKKRLEILKRDNFTCQECLDTEQTLHVHHCNYIKGKKPWEYENESLITLCELCHQIETDDFYNMRNWMGSNIAATGARVADFMCIGAAFEGAEIACDKRDFFIALSRHLKRILNNPELQIKLLHEYKDGIK